MSPPLVVAFAIAGTVLLNTDRDPLATDTAGRPVYLRDLWPADEEIAALLRHAEEAALYRQSYADFSQSNEFWARVPAPTGEVFPWDPASTYIRQPPFFDRFSTVPAPAPAILGMRALGIYGDSLTTDHISPVASIRSDSPAGAYLIERGVEPSEFSNFGMRRCNHEVMARGAFANVRIRNRMAPAREGGYTTHQPSGELLTVFEASRRYLRDNVPLVVFGGEEYGTGSSRDWAAKGPLLLGVKAVVARSFERIHRSNLVGMGILPLQFLGDDSVETLGLDGTETFDLPQLHDIAPGGEVRMLVRAASGRVREVRLRCRIDTDIEVDYYRHGGILPYMLRELVAG